MEVLNLEVLNLAAMAYSEAGGKSFGSPHILENLYVPKFDPRDRKHRRVAELARSIQERFGDLSKGELDAAEADLDRAAAAVWGITDDELAEIWVNYRELTKADLREAWEAERRENRGSEEGEEAADTSEVVLSTLEGGDEMTSAEIAAAAELDMAELRPLLRRLVEEGRLEQVGRGRGTRYRLLERGEEA